MEREGLANLILGGGEAIGSFFYTRLCDIEYKKASSRYLKSRFDIVMNHPQLSPVQTAVVKES